MILFIILTWVIGGYAGGAIYYGYFEGAYPDIYSPQKYRNEAVLLAVMGLGGLIAGLIYVPFLSLQGYRPPVWNWIVAPPSAKRIQEGS